MSQVYNTQSLLTLSLETNYSQVGAANTVRKILYKKPSGAVGEWLNPTINGTKLERQFQPGDISEVGVWSFQVYLLFDGKTAYGDIVKQDFQKPLK